MTQLKLWILISTVGVFSAQANPTLGIEAGAVWQTRNDVKIPPSQNGSMVALDEIFSGPDFAFRTELTYKVAPHHGIRVLFAPLRLEFDGVPKADIKFDGSEFSSGIRTDFAYQFNSYRATYFYSFYGDEIDRLNVGFTAKIRDAEIYIAQGSRSESYTNVGFVPLLYFEYQKGFWDLWRFNFTLDGLAGGPGRAFDVALKLRRDLGSSDVGIGYRTIEGGAENDKVLTFSWLHYAVIDFQYSF